MLLRVFKSGRLVAIKFILESRLSPFLYILNPSEDEIVEVAKNATSYACNQIANSYPDSEVIMKELVFKKPFFFSCANKGNPILNDRSLALEILEKFENREFGFILNFMTPTLQDDKELVCLALRNGASLSSVSKRLRDEYDIADLAISINKSNFVYISDRLKDNNNLQCAFNNNNEGL